MSIEMKPIKSFADAKQRLAELKNSIVDLDAFLTFADDAISKVNTLKGSTNGANAQPATHAPATWGERVIEIFKQTGNKPLMQKQAVDRYLEIGWPVNGDTADLYRNLSGAIAYLPKKKGGLARS